MDDNLKVKIKKTSKKIRKNILLMALHAGHSSAHIGGALSSVDIISTLYETIFKYDKRKIIDENRDRFILSKGHGCLTYYSILNHIGFLSDEELLTFEKDGSSLLGHPVKNISKGIEFSNGSLGMGLSIGIGLSIGYKRLNRANKIFTLLGDGECNEGSIWEAVMSAPKFNLDNLTVFIDNNNYQQTGSNIEILKNNNLDKKWKNFGWNTRVIDGHNIEQIYDFLISTQDLNKKPNLAVCKTIKGKGVSFAENNNEWHHSVLTQKNYDIAIKEVESNET
jgi:transketolase